MIVKACSPNLWRQHTKHSSDEAAYEAHGVFFMILVRRMKTTLAHKVGVSLDNIPG